MPSAAIQQPTLQEKKHEAWRTENAAAIEEYNARIEKNGVFSDGLRSF